MRAMEEVPKGARDHGDVCHYSACRGVGSPCSTGKGV